MKKNSWKTLLSVLLLLAMLVSMLPFAAFAEGDQTAAAQTEEPAKTEDVPKVEEKTGDTPKADGKTDATKTDEKADYNKMKANVMEEVKRLFKPEFINRIDEIMVFHPLTEKDMKQIITLLSKNLCDRCKTQMDIDLTFTSTLKDYLVKKYSDLKMGARPLKRAIQNVVEDELATAILEGRVKRGDVVHAGIKNDKITFTVKESK